MRASHRLAAGRPLRGKGRCQSGGEQNETSQAEDARSRAPAHPNTCGARRSSAPRSLPLCVTFCHRPGCQRSQSDIVKAPPVMLDCLRARPAAAVSVRSPAGGALAPVQDDRILLPAPASVKDNRAQSRTIATSGGIPSCTFESARRRRNLQSHAQGHASLPLLKGLRALMCPFLPDRLIHGEQHIARHHE